MCFLNSFIFGTAREFGRDGNLIALLTTRELLLIDFFHMTGFDMATTTTTTMTATVVMTSVVECRKKRGRGFEVYFWHAPVWTTAMVN